MSEICELRAVAYHDITSIKSQDNLYHIWALMKTGKNETDHVALKSEFLEFIEEQCNSLL